VNAVVIGVGNPFRRDDGIGPAVAQAVAARGPAGVDVDVVDGEPIALLDAWEGADLAVVVDAVRCDPATPGRVHRAAGDSLPAGHPFAGTHAVGIADAMRLAEVLGRAPRRLVVFAVEAADLELGVGLSPAVEAAVPELVEAVVAELAERR
jgi:hydrogenase maturation protease